MARNSVAIYGASKLAQSLEHGWFLGAFVVLPSAEPKTRVASMIR